MKSYESAKLDPFSQIINGKAYPIFELIIGAAHYTTLCLLR